MKHKGKNKKIYNKNNQRSKRERLKRLVSEKRRGKFVTGRFFPNAYGGIVVVLSPDGTLSEEKYRVDSPYTRGAMYGDTVEAEFFGGSDVRVRNVSVRANERLIGIYHIDERYDPPAFVEPQNAKIRFDITVVGCEAGRMPEDGDKVEIRLTAFPESEDDGAEGVITEVFGAAGSGRADYEAILHSLDIRTTFPEGAIREAERLGETEIRPDGRRDLRTMTILTMDGATAKDLDDAVSASRDGDGYLLGVHIADVSHYVAAGSATDVEARARGTSIYFADKVVPMLPVALSNGICSLDSGTDRYALSAFLTLDKFGEIKNTEICKSIINTKVRGVYSEIDRVLDGSADADTEAKYASVTEDGTLSLMEEIYHVLKRKYEARGALALDSADDEIVLDAEGKPLEIRKAERGESAMMIEQFMLCANEGVATFMSKKGLPCVYRIHEKPDTEKVSRLLGFANAVGLCPEYVKKQTVSSAYFNRLLEKARKKDMGIPVSYMLLRTMRKARYSEKNEGHFGLSSRCYCHFTSPIRRYPDLCVHRILSEYLERGDVDEVTKRYSAFVAEASASSTECEIKALEAERSISDLYKTIWMKGHTGEEFDATVSSVTSFGLFCMLDNTCEGLVPLDSMKNSYFFGEREMSLESAAVTYRLGDKVRIKIVFADVSAAKTEFALVDEPDGGVRYKFKSR